MGLALLVTFQPCLWFGFAAGSPSTGTPGQVALHGIQQEIEIAEVLRRLQRPLLMARSPSVMSRSRLDPDRESVTADRTVIVEHGRITSVGDSAGAPDAPATTIIDGKGRFLAPGLVDMHVHSSSAAGWLLDLTNSVTTVRDMDGSSVVAETAGQRRSRQDAGSDSLYVAGTIVETRGRWTDMPSFRQARTRPTNGERTSGNAVRIYQDSQRYPGSDV